MDELIHVVDILPTLAGVAGIRVATDGQSFLPALHGFPLTRPFVYVVGIEGEEAVITRRYKLRVLLDGSQEIYDLVRDPNEISPLDPDNLPATADKLRAYLQEARGD